MCEAGLWGIKCAQQGTQRGGKPDRVVSPDSLSGTKLAVILECLRKETPAASLIAQPHSSSGCESPAP